jgi:hypothetical protein
LIGPRDGPDRRGSVAEGLAAGLVEVFVGVVGIFSLSSHPVITIIMLWRRWTTVLGRA